MNSTEHKRRSSRSGSLVNTPDHQSKQMTASNGPLFSLDDSGETSNYLEVSDSSATNSSCCSFDVSPHVPPVPPRITNPPPRNTRMTEHLIIIDTDDAASIDAPIPVARAKLSKMQKPMTTVNNTTTTVTIAKPSVQKSMSGVNRGRTPHIDPPPKLIHHKLNLTTETITSEVRRIPP